MKLTFEELLTLLAQVEACLKSRPLAASNVPDEDGNPHTRTFSDRMATVYTPRPPLISPFCVPSEALGPLSKPPSALLAKMVGRLRDLAEQVYKMAAPKQKSSSWRRCSSQGGQHLPYQVAPCSSRSGAPWQGRLCTCSHSEDSEGRIQEAPLLSD